MSPRIRPPASFSPVGFASRTSSSRPASTLTYRESYILHGWEWTRATHDCSLPGRSVAESDRLLTRAPEVAPDFSPGIAAFRPWKNVHAKMVFSHLKSGLDRARQILLNLREEFAE